MAIGKITKKEALSSLIIAGAVLIGTPLLMTVVPVIYDIPAVGISIGALLSATALAYGGSMIAHKYV